MAQAVIKQKIKKEHIRRDNNNIANQVTKEHVCDYGTLILNRKSKCTIHENIMKRIEMLKIQIKNTKNDIEIEKHINIKLKLQIKKSMHQNYNNYDVKTAYYCDICDEYFASSWALGGHKSYHSQKRKENIKSKSKKKKYYKQCSICQKSFNSYQSYGGHKKSCK